jgi:hypothetical protein
MSTKKTIKIIGNDISIVSGQTQILTDYEALGQILSNKIKTWKGSYWNDATIGTDWLRLLEEGDVDRFKIAILKILKSDSRVLKIQALNLELDRTTRELSGSFTVQTTLGTVTGGI